RRRRYRRPAPGPVCARTDPRSRDGARRRLPRPPPGRRPSRRPNEILATSGCLFEWRGIARPDAVDRWHIVDEFDDGGGLATHVATVEDGIELVIEELFERPASGEGLRLIGKEQC